MAKQAKVKVRVSTQPVVVMEAEVARKIRQHARSSMKAEVCGVLIGNTEHERMTVEACIAGINAAQGGAHVTFTQDTWEHIYKIKDKDFPDHKIVGWYHSHPGFGVFLSEHDLFIQQNFFSNPQQVAWVYDPHTDEEGCFGWIGGNIEKLSAIRVGYSQSVEITGSAADDYENAGEGDGPAVDSMVRSPREKGRREEPAWIKWTSLTMGYIAAIVLGFVLGHQWLARQVDPVIQGCRELYQRVAPFISTPGAPLPDAQSQPAQPQNQQQSSPQPKAPVKKGNNGKH